MLPMMSAMATGERGDGEVVEDLADGVGEGPAVGEVHEGAVDRVEQGHACCEQDREAEDGDRGRPPAAALRRWRAAPPRWRVEAEAEEQPSGYICQDALTAGVARP